MPPGANTAIGIHVGVSRICATNGTDDHQLGTTPGSLHSVVVNSFMRFGPPAVCVIGGAGPVDSQDGTVKIAYRPEWDAFRPRMIEKMYGSKVIMLTDEIIRVKNLTNMHAVTLIEGVSSDRAPWAVVTIGAGVSSDLRLNNGLTFKPDIGSFAWQPATELESQLLKTLQLQYPATRTFSYEQMLANSHLFRLYGALRECAAVPPSPQMQEQIDKIIARQQDLCAFLVGQVSTVNDPFCALMLGVVESLMGQYFRNLALGTNCRRGIQLSGMKASTAKYLFREGGDLRRAYLGGDKHNDWLSQIPFTLVPDPRIGAQEAYSYAIDVY